MESSRTPTAITLSVWKALFLREAVSRLSTGRAAWVWLLMEPMVHVIFLMFIYTAIRTRVVGGIDTIVWLIVGLMAFFMFRRTAVQTMNAVGQNQALFAYRQVKPVDSVLVRAGLEGLLAILVTVILFSGAGLFGLAIIPDDPLAVLSAFFGLWLVGLGFGLITSVASELIPELGRLIGMAMTPLYLFSGVIFPLEKLPPPYRDWLLLNPVAHGVEAARLGYSSYYEAVPELNVAYVYGFALIVIFLGLALHNRFATRLAAQ
jgi:capsular polysaccharide transport system permease protein